MDTSVNSICALEWVSKPSLYRDFGSEDGLTAAVLQRYAEVVLARMDDLLASPVSFAAKCEAMIQFASADPQMETGYLFVKMKSTRSRFGIRTQAIIADIDENALRIYTRFSVKEPRAANGNLALHANSQRATCTNKSGWPWRDL